MDETASVQTKTDNRPLSAKERFWSDHYLQWERSGLSLAGYARSNGLVVKTFYGWHHRLKKRGLAKPEPAPTLFHRVTVRPAESPPATIIETATLRFRLPNGIECEVAGLQLNRYAGFLETLACVRL